MNAKRNRLALRVSLNSALMILAVYFVMQVLAYFRDNAIMGQYGLSALPHEVFRFIGLFVLPPTLIFAALLYLAAIPLQKTLDILRSAQALDPERAERTHLRMLSFSRVVLALNILGFALGYAILVLIEDGPNGLIKPHRLIILVSNLAGAAVYASAQSSLNNLAFAELRDRLGLTAIGKRRREMPRNLRQVIMGLCLVVYVLSFLQFNEHMLLDYQNLALSYAGSGLSDPERAANIAADFRSRVPEVIPSVRTRPGFNLSSLTPPWENPLGQAAKEYWVFLLNGLFMLSMALLTLLTDAFDLRDQLRAMRERLLDVVEGQGDLRQRLTLRSMDEYGELAELVNRVLDSFRQVIRNIGASAEQSRQVADSVDSVLREAEAVSQDSAKAIVKLAASLEAEAAESKAIGQTLESFKLAAKEVAASVEAQRRVSDDTAAAMHQMEANINSVELMTRRSGELSGELSLRGAAGVDSASETGKAIGDIQSSASDVLKVLSSLSRIAAETNLLAMNAAIEAAHAGDMGAGFAVVADEVRGLANKAQEETKSIKALMSNMNQKVSRGVETASLSGNVFSSLAEGIDQAAGISLEISGAMKEQAIGIKSVSDSIRELVSAAQSIQRAMDAQEASTGKISENLRQALGRLSGLSEDSRAQSLAVERLMASFAKVRQAVDGNIRAASQLETELTKYKL